MKILINIAQIADFSCWESQQKTTNDISCKGERSLKISTIVLKTKEMEIDLKNVFRLF